MTYNRNFQVKTVAYYVRLMRKEDVPQVNSIEREAFPTEWPPANYDHELRNRLAYYIVAYDETEVAERVEGGKADQRKGSSGLVFRLKRFFRGRFADSEFPPPDKHYILGYAGFWLMAGEAHITSIAVRERYHHQGIGEILILSLLELAAELNAHLVTLEARISNAAAQRLYLKCGFAEVGTRRGYYSDNGEDGILMSLEDITSASVQANLQQLKATHAQRWGNAACRIDLQH